MRTPWHTTLRSTPPPPARDHLKSLLVQSPSSGTPPLDDIGGNAEALVTKEEFIRMFTSRKRSPPRSPISRETSAPVMTQSRVRPTSPPPESRGRSSSVKAMPFGQHIASGRPVSPMSMSPQQFIPAVTAFPRAANRSLSPPVLQSAAREKQFAWSAQQHVQENLQPRAVRQASLAAMPTQYLQGAMHSQPEAFTQQMQPAVAATSDMLTVTSGPCDRGVSGAAQPSMFTACVDNTSMSATSDSAEYRLHAQIQELRQEFKEGIKAEIEQVRTEVHGLLMNMTEFMNASLREEVSQAIQQELPSLGDHIVAQCVQARAPIETSHTVGNDPASCQAGDHIATEGAALEFMRPPDQRFAELPGIVYELQQSAKGLDCMLREVLKITCSLAKDLADERQRRREELDLVTQRFENLEQTTCVTSSSQRSHNTSGVQSSAIQSSLQLPSGGLAAPTESIAPVAVRQPVHVPSSRSIIGNVSASSSSLISGHASGTADVSNDEGQTMPLEARPFADIEKEIAVLSERIMRSDLSIEDMFGLSHKTTMLSEILEQNSLRNG